MQNRVLFFFAHTFLAFSVFRSLRPVTCVSDRVTRDTLPSLLALPGVHKPPPQRPPPPPMASPASLDVRRSMAAAVNTEFRTWVDVHEELAGEVRGRGRAGTGRRAPCRREASPPPCLPPHPTPPTPGRPLCRRHGSPSRPCLRHGRRRRRRRRRRGRRARRSGAAPCRSAHGTRPGPRGGGVRTARQRATVSGHRFRGGPAGRGSPGGWGHHRRRRRRGGRGAPCRHRGRAGR